MDERAIREVRLFVEGVEQLIEQELYTRGRPQEIEEYETDKSLIAATYPDETDEEHCRRRMNEIRYRVARLEWAAKERSK
jgi:hypothetical protein